MLIVCPACVSSYKIDPALLARADATLRCAHCRRPLRAETMPAERGTPVGPTLRETSPLAAIAAVCAILLLVSAALHWRESLMRHVPGAAMAFGLIGLQMAAAVPQVTDLTAALTPDGLRVTGQLANPSRTPVPVPRLYISIRDGGTDTLYSWTAPAPKARLAPGETVSFTSHLDKPPAAGHDLAVSFVTDRLAVTEQGGKTTR